ncbi:hypothetical protein [Massilia endophytica]|uniref:hypothetical protein n=1 Tax=Massilia endophytica TaxID=2899220 RepID=UPI001E4472CD|nr:hypothetical protein [Massilia endophytica]UGQ44843.1 hypothetical protein LSQ66_13640 [Massilia endophytica]
MNVNPRPCIYALALSAALSGCASPPAEQAMFGNPQPLSEMILRGQLQDLNARLPSSNVDSRMAVTPLCALSSNAARAAPAIDYLLARGVDVNKPCDERSPNTAMDYLIAEIINRASPDSPYRANPQYRPSDLPVLYAVAQKMIDKGAVTHIRRYTIADIQEKVREAVGQNNANLVAHHETYKATVARNQQILGAAGAVAGVVAGAKILASDSTAGGIARNSLSALSNRADDKPGPSVASAAGGPAVQSPSRLPANAAAGAKGQIWRDDYRNEVIATGEIKDYPDHERNIPGDVVMAKVGSRTSAEQVWTQQGGTVTDYSHCGSCGVGSRIRVVVKFRQIIDYHDYVREK